MSFHVPNAKRVINGALASTIEHGNNGLFVLDFKGVELFCIASDGKGWEHVSVSLKMKRCPNWPEMCFVKRMFWDDDDCVLQYHPPEKDYVDTVRNCLHLWRPGNAIVRRIVPRPAKILVGI